MIDGAPREFRKPWSYTTCQSSWVGMLSQIWPPGGVVGTEPLSWQQVSLKRLLKPGEVASLETEVPAGGRGHPARSMRLGWPSLWRSHIFAGISGGETG